MKGILWGVVLIWAAVGYCGPAHTTLQTAVLDRPDGYKVGQIESGVSIDKLQTFNGFANIRLAAYCAKGFDGASVTLFNSPSGARIGVAPSDALNIIRTTGGFSLVWLEGWIQESALVEGTYSDSNAVVLLPASLDRPAPYMDNPAVRKTTGSLLLATAVPTALVAVVAFTLAEDYDDRANVLISVGADSKAMENKRTVMQIVGGAAAVTSALMIVSGLIKISPKKSDQALSFRPAINLDQYGLSLAVKF